MTDEVEPLQGYTVKVRPAAKKIKYTCPGCGSDNVQISSWSNWDAARQTWVHVESQESDCQCNYDFYCCNCGCHVEDLNITTLRTII